LTAPTYPAPGQKAVLLHPPIDTEGDGTISSRWQALEDGIATLEGCLATASHELEHDRQALLSTLVLSLEQLAAQIESELGEAASSGSAQPDVLDLDNLEASPTPIAGPPIATPPAHQLDSLRRRLKAATDRFFELAPPLATHEAQGGSVEQPAPRRGGLRATVLRRSAEPPAAARQRATALTATALTALGLVMVAFAVFQFRVTDLTEARNQRQLRAELAKRLTIARADAISADPASGVVGTPGGEAPPVAGRSSSLAVMKIPAIGLDKVVVEGSGANDLKRGPGHYRGTPLPGHAGNVVVAGRRTTYGKPFRSIDKVKKGDGIDFITTEGAFTYRVEDVKVVRQGEQDVLAQTAEDRLTLVSSHPRYRASSRLAVFARLEGAAVDANLAAVPRTEPATITSDERGLTADVTATGQVLLWGQLFAAAYLLTRILYRRWRPWSSWVVTTPVVLALTFLFFESLDRLLPSTL